MSIKDLFPIGEKFTIEYNTTDVSPEAFTEIRDYCYRLYNVQFNDIVGSAWMDTDNKYPGSLPKRIASWYFKHCDIRVSPEVKAHIGSIAKNGMVETGRYIFDFTDKFDWYPGDYGDSDSCFMRNEWYRRNMETYGVYAMRFYDIVGKGIARCLVVFPTEESSFRVTDEFDRVSYYNAYPGFAVICNAYNHAQGLTLKRINILLQKFLDMPSYVVSMDNYNHDIFYTNRKRTTESEVEGHMYLFSADPLAPRIRTVELNWDGHRRITCEGCNLRRKEYMANTNLCEECMIERSFVCDRCGRYTLRADEQIVGYYDYSRELVSAHLCPACYREGMRPCFVCGTPVPDFVIGRAKVDGVYQKVCSNHTLSRCPICNCSYVEGHPCQHEPPDVLELKRYGMYGTTSRTNTWENTATITVEAVEKLMRVLAERPEINNLVNMEWRIGVDPGLPEADEHIVPLPQEPLEGEEHD